LICITHRTMKLLHCETKRLHEFVGDNIPPYAILSHTWEAEEVVFADLAQDGSNLDYRKKEGWRKIQKSCDQATSDGLDWLWADTICINKESSAELSEAINSMFKWYRDSTVCYAYLCDLPSGPFSESRWFTRGFTLQEMIAPRRLLFYDRDWTCVGAKSGLLDELERITGVNAAALQGGNLRLFSVARRMSWASRRRTTRVEDVAYCLLGIFDISMPLLYGEGAKAFIRLQEEIIKEYDDESLFAWVSDANGPGADRSTTGVLAPSPACFAYSADFVPCLTPAAELSMSPPITVTSRGIRLKVPVEPLDCDPDYGDKNGGDDKAASPTTRRNTNNRFLVRLNCKRVAYGRQSSTRTGIVVTPFARIQGFESRSSVYGRAQPDRLHEFLPNPGLAPSTLYLSKESYLHELDLALYDVFWVRTMPRWPSALDAAAAALRDRPAVIATGKRKEETGGVAATATTKEGEGVEVQVRKADEIQEGGFQLAEHHPTATWNQTNELFRWPRADQTLNKQPFVLAFRRERAGGWTDWFIVTFGKEITPDHMHDGILGGRIWLNAVFKSAQPGEKVDVVAETEGLDRSERTVTVRGAGVSLKCHVRPEIISGQPLFCVDLLVH
jgi:hypothetical protein